MVFGVGTNMRDQREGQGRGGKSVSSRYFQKGRATKKKKEDLSANMEARDSRGERNETDTVREAVGKSSVSPLHLHQVR